MPLSGVRSCQIVDQGLFGNPQLTTDLYAVDLFGADQLIRCIFPDAENGHQIFHSEGQRELLERTIVTAYGYTLSPDKRPVTTADTTAELGCGRWHLSPPPVSFDPPGCGSGINVPALPEPCCHHGAQVGRLPRSLGGFPAVPP